MESITALKTILNNRKNHGKSTYVGFIDFTKSFDRVEHKMHFDVLKKKRVKQAETRLICEKYNKQRAFMLTDSERENEIKIIWGVRQGCILSPILFNIYAEEAFRSCKNENGIEIYEKKKIYKISDADDTVIITESEKELNDTLNKKSNLQRWSIEINPKRTKCIVFTDNETQKIDIQIGDDKLEQVSNFQYLGTWINETMKHDVDVGPILRNLSKPSGTQRTPAKQH